MCGTRGRHSNASDRQVQGVDCTQEEGQEAPVNLHKAMQVQQERVRLLLLCGFLQL